MLEKEDQEAIMNYINKVISRRGPHLKWWNIISFIAAIAILVSLVINIENWKDVVMGTVELVCATCLILLPIYWGDRYDR